MYLSHIAYESITTRIIVSIITIKTSIIVHIHKFLFCFFVLSTKLTYSSSKFVLMFILYVFNTTLKNMNLITCEYETLSILNEGLLVRYL